jgi:hypothetical protein
VLISGLLGLPPNYGLIPQAPLHVRSLAKIKEVRSGSGTGGLAREVWVRVTETRVSALGQSLLLFVLLSDPLLRALAAIPSGVLAGQFVYLGAAGLQGNPMAQRIHYLAMSRPMRRQAEAEGHAAWAGPGGYKSVALWVGLQLVLVAVIFGITLTPAGIIFPVLIVLLVPLRLWLLPCLLPAAWLHALDPLGVFSLKKPEVRQDAADSPVTATETDVQLAPACEPGGTGIDRGSSAAAELVNGDSSSSDEAGSKMIEVAATPPPDELSHTNGKAV